MKLANLITLGRLAFVTLALVLLAVHPQHARGHWWGDWPIFGLLLVAAVTDYLDGWVARRLEQCSSFGRILDPFVDKVLVCGALILFLELREIRGFLPAWVVVVIVCREFLVQTIRGVVESRGVAFGADWFGKWKMVFQCVLVLAFSAYLGGWDWPLDVARWMLWLVVVVTVLSGLNYLRKGWHVLEF